MPLSLSSRIKFNRRTFLKGMSASTASAGLPLFHLTQNTEAATGNFPPSDKLESWQDLYKARWSWDSITRGSHGWMNCRSACNWDLYVKDGIVVREEQSANYEQAEPNVPDLNPRGCQKGGCYTEVMYGPTRITTPLKRAGKRGEGKWQKITWQQAIDEIAEKYVDIAIKHGSASINHEPGTYFDYGATFASLIRFATLFGSSAPDTYAEVGDLNMGATLTLGMPLIGGSSDEWFLSDYLVVWMMNPAVTQMPDTHFLYEAKYNGADLVVIDPVHSATAIRADKWLPIKPGTDAALGLATARHIWATDKIDLPYLQEQTDFPLLIRTDTGRFLREKDLIKGGKKNLYYVWDLNQEKAIPASGCEGNEDDYNLGLNGTNPAIEGFFEVRSEDGELIPVMPVGATIKEQLDEWTFEKAANATGMSLELIRDFAVGFANAKRPMILSSYGSNRYLHSDLMNRTKLLCLSLKGCIGNEKGAGFSSIGFHGMEGYEEFITNPGTGMLGQMKMMAKLAGNAEVFSTMVDQLVGKKSKLQARHKLFRQAHPLITPNFTDMTSQNYHYQGIKEDIATEMDDLYPRKFDDYVTESIEKDWMPVSPRSGKIRARIMFGSNLLRRNNMTAKLIAEQWNDLELTVDMNFKMSYTSMHCDYVLPVAGYYEKPGIKFPVSFAPYLQYCDVAVKPLGESKDEWEIHWLLSEAIQRIAKERDLAPLENVNGDENDLKTLCDRFSLDNKYGPHDAEKITEDIIVNSHSCEDMDIEAVKKEGIQKFKSVGAPGWVNHIYNSDWDGVGVLQPLTDFIRHKTPWPTLHGRQQYYIDHPWFIEAGEAVPTHKESPEAGGSYEYQMISCHSRWSVHSTWRDTPLLLRMQRGEPVMYLNPSDAKLYNLEDNDWGVFFNRYGEFRMRVKLSTMIRPKVVFYFHAWEPSQFPDHNSFKNIIPGLINPLHFAGDGGEGQMVLSAAHYSPGSHVQDTRVGIRKWQGEKLKTAEDLIKEQKRNSTDKQRISL
ncbi:hypothetical protein R50073_18250 [Maricurvus nonylphenolicus]|uniref:molybdopterin-dependent oxidoreductase n=1 Tax=Maricurvus nonylphenolicus TaxID=1008307 RepID=UPI0036F28B5F